MLFKNKKYIVSIFLTAFIIFCTHILGYADENSAPVFIDGNRTIRSIAENTPAGVNIGAPVAATDADNDTLTYTKGWLDGTAFTLDSNTGQIRTKAPLDYETKSVYSFAIFVDDGNGGRRVISVTINVTDVDETAGNNAPTFTDGDSATRSVAENTASGRNIGNPIAATDADTGDTLTYTLGGTDAASFSIVSTSGQLRTSAALNYESKSSYSVSISVSDSNGATDSIAVTINVTDVNEKPSFNISGRVTLSVEEDTASGTNIGAPFQATDPDSGDTLTYSLQRGDKKAFRIDANTGQLRTHAALDYETKRTYNNLAVRATDSGGLVNSVLVTIKVTDVSENRAPVFTSGTSTTRSVAENAASGTNIGSAIAATDADTGDTLTYTLGGTDASSFSIVSTSGQLQTSAALDYETKSSYSVTVSVSDGNGGSDSIAVTVNVADVNENRAPAFSEGTSTTRSVAENTALGTNIGSAIAATDVDTGDTLTYTLGGTDASSFRIVSTSGQLQTNVALNHEADNSYAVTVSVSDGNGGTDSIAVTISVTDVNEKPSFSTFGRVTLSVPENTASGRNIGRPFQATDPDSGDTLTYSLQRGDKNVFRIDARTGQLQTRAALDYETKRTYNNLAVRATDSGGLVNSVLVTINITDVNENRAPAFNDGTSTTRSVAENTRSGTNIGSPVAATDADTSDTLTYTLGGADASLFSIVGTSGQLRTSAALNYESKSSYSVSVSVSDKNGGSDSIAVTINVTNVNEAPAFSAGASISNISATAGTAITSVALPEATDVDAGNTITYTVTPALPAGLTFTASTRTLSGTPTTETASATYTYTASDGTLSATLTFSIQVSAAPNNAPVFNDGTETTRSIAENTPSGRNIGSAIAATDTDSGDTLTYTLGGTDASSFRIVSTSGQLQTSAALDYESKSSYSVSVSVSDGSGGSDSIAVTINVTDVSEFTPVNERTRQVRDAIVAAVPNVNNAADVTAAHLAAITSLSIDYRRITALKVGDFDGFTSLTNLVLKHNSISDISALKNLTSLKWLFLGFNPISDISALKNLTALEWLYLHNNSISDISTLKNLTSLKQLFLSYNSISDISALKNLTALNWIDLSRNSISSISALKNLTALTNLKMDWNSISDISALKNLTALTDLNLHWNPISDISALENLTSLKRLILSNNWISDISALENLTALTELALNNNSISDVSALENLTALTELGLSGNQILDYGPLRRLKAAIEVIEGHPGLTLDITIPAVANNNAPVFSDGDSTTRSVAENTASGTNIGSVVAATDEDTGDTLTYHLGGTDADSFRIVKSSGQLQTNAELDAETKSTYTVKVAVSDGKGGTDSITVTINVTDVVGAAPSLETSLVIPDNTALLTNFPNPFNPETWIPYQLAKPAEVTLTIYDVRGRIVRKLRLGHQPAGIYQSRSKAAHWDGRNQLGEKVATGVYFYTLKAGNYFATRKLLIRK